MNGAYQWWLFGGKGGHSMQSSRMYADLCIIVLSRKIDLVRWEFSNWKAFKADHLYFTRGLRVNH